jgi:DNA polymerase III subunit alpha
MNKNFVHLHLHTAYSLLDGANKIPDLVIRAKELKMPAMAITDHGVMYGIIDFYKQLKEAGIKPIIGCEAYLTVGSRKDRINKGPEGVNHHLVLLAENFEGYQNLVQMISVANMEGFYYKPRIDKELLRKHHKGIIALSGCLQGEVSYHLAREDKEKALAAAIEYRDIFGKDNFFLEIMDHNLKEQRLVNSMMPEIAAKTGLRMVATNDAHYLKKEHAKAHDALLCIQTGKLLSDENRMRYSSDQFYVKSYEEMSETFKEFPGVVDITMEIADRCNVEIPMYLEAKNLHFPPPDIPEGMTEDEYFQKLAFAGIKKLYNVEDPGNPKDEREQEILDRFNHEFKIIKKTGFVSYFLVVADFIKYALDQDIPVGPGRGSGGGSIVAYALGIISIDPLKYNLIFERFLNPDRVSPPDFDIDFCQTRRGEVIDYVKNKYGADHVAQIITFGSLGAKTVIRDVGKILDIPYAKCNALSKLVPEDLKMTLPKAFETSPDFRKAIEEDEDFQKIMEFAPVLEGLLRNPGVHAAGVVIGEQPLQNVVPLSRDKNNEPVTQYAKEPVEDIGFLKMDFLGLKTLTVIKEAIDIIREQQGVDIDVEKLDMNDKPTYDLLNRADTVGVFQLESGGMRDLIKQIGINNIEDLVAVIALYRPGPMEMLPDYIARKTGKATLEYDHPLLQPILSDTYGVMVYQEQVQKAANVLAGYSLGEADILRRAMGKKKPEVMKVERVKFVEGCVKTNNISEKLAGSIFDNIERFAGYGFNKAHSVGYGIIGFRTAYLKANYPAAFMAAILSSEMGNADKLPGFIAEASEMGCPVLPPDVNKSKCRFWPEKDGIRFGLAGIKNVGVGVSNFIVAEREANGPFKGLIDFCSRLDSSVANKKSMESLIRSGALDCFDAHRAQLFEGIEFAVARAAEKLRDKTMGQANFFDLLDGKTDESTDDEKEDLPQTEEWSESDMLAAERELLGAYMTGHPLVQYERVLNQYQVSSISEIYKKRPEGFVRIGGLINLMTKKMSKDGRNWAILKLEDLEKTIEVLVFADIFEKYSYLLEDDATIMVSGEISARDDEAKIVAQEIIPMDMVPKRYTKEIILHIPTTLASEDMLKKIKSVLKLYPGNIPISICLMIPTGEKIFISVEQSCYVEPMADLFSKLKHIIGEQGVFVSVDRTPPKKQERSWGKQNHEN